MAKYASSRRTHLGAMKAGLILAAICLTALSGCSHDGPARNSAGHIIQSGSIETADLRIGDCFSSADNNDVSAVTATPCDKPHNAEVIGRTTATGSSFNTNSLGQQAEAYCPAAADSYLGEAWTINGGLTLSYLQPSSGSWDDNDRAIACVIRTTNGDSTLTASLKGQYSLDASPGD